MINKVLVQIIAILLLSSTLFGSDLYEDYMYKDEMLKNGKMIYQNTCVSCHGKSGESNSKIKLVVKPRKLNKTILTPEQSFKIIRDGAHTWGANSDMMPTFKYVLDDDAIRDVTFYITQAFNSKRDERVTKLLKESDVITKEDEVKMLEVGKSIFMKKCSACHGTKGNGKSEYISKSKLSGKLIYPYNLTKTLLDESQIFLYAKYGGYFWGTNQKNINSCNENYTDIELKSVAKYVNEKIKKKQE